MWIHNVLTGLCWTFENHGQIQSGKWGSDIKTSLLAFSDLQVQHLHPEI